MAGLARGRAKVLSGEGAGEVEDSGPGWERADGTCFCCCCFPLGVKGTCLLLLEEKMLRPLGVEGTWNLGWLCPSESELSPNW